MSKLNHPVHNSENKKKTVISSSFRELDLYTHTHTSGTYHTGQACHHHYTFTAATAFSLPASDRGSTDFLRSAIPITAASTAISILGILRTADSSQGPGSSGDLQTDGGFGPKWGNAYGATPYCRRVFI